MSEIFKLETNQTIICDDCAQTIPRGPVWFCPECLANLCNGCNDYHNCNI
jgi:hypothetical protein